MTRARGRGVRALAAALAASACLPRGDGEAEAPVDDDAPTVDMEERLAQYATVRLQADLSQLTDADRRMVPLLIAAVEPMDSVYWREAYGDRAALRARVSDPRAWRYAEINYGPWDRLAGNEPFLPGTVPSHQAPSSIRPT